METCRGTRRSLEMASFGSMAMTRRAPNCRGSIAQSKPTSAGVLRGLYAGLGLAHHVAAVSSSSNADGRSQIPQSSVHCKCRSDVESPTRLTLVFTYAHGFPPDLMVRDRARPDDGWLHGGLGLGQHDAAVSSSGIADGRSQIPQSPVHFKSRSNVGFPARGTRAFIFAHGLCS